jgi:hypothetical protein
MEKTRDTLKLKRWCIRKRGEELSVVEISTATQTPRRTFYNWWNKYQQQGPPIIYCPTYPSSPSLQLLPGSSTDLQASSPCPPLQGLVSLQPPVPRRFDDGLAFAISPHDIFREPACVE